MFKYYFVITALPKLSLNQRLDLTFDEVMRLFELNLSKNDLDKIISFRRFIDILNLKKIWQNKDIDIRGNLNKNELNDQLLIQDLLYDFVFEYMQKYDSNENRLKKFSFLTSNFFNKIINESTGFLKNYFSFIRSYRLILTALRCKTLNRDIALELQFEDPFDDLTMYLLAQKDMDDLIVPIEFEDLKKIYLKNKNDVKKLHLSLLEYKLNKIDDLLDKNPFTIDEILAYFTKFLIIQDYQNLSLDKGKEKLEQII
jgi:hypothetical protein